MLPTLEEAQVMRKAFPRVRVTSHSAHASVAAWTYAARTVADLVVELPAETRPMSFLSHRTWREVGAAGGSRRGRGSP